MLVRLNVRRDDKFDLVCVVGDQPADSSRGDRCDRGHVPVNTLWPEFVFFLHSVAGSTYRLLLQLFVIFIRFKVVGLLGSFPQEQRECSLQDVCEMSSLQ